MTNRPRLLAIYLAIAAPALAQDRYDRWSDIAPVPFAVGSSGSGGTVSPDADSILVFGGHLRTAKLTISTNTWTSGPAAGIPAPQPPGTQGDIYGCWGAALVPGTQTVYALFNDQPNGSAALYSVDLATGTWSGALARLMVEPASGMTLTASPTHLFALGGINSPGRTGAYTYTIATNAWTTLANFPSQEEDGASLVFHEGTTLYGIGGSNQTKLVRGAFQAPNFVTWTALPLPGNSMPLQVGSALVSDAANGHLYLCSGNTGNATNQAVYQVRSTLYRFDPAPQQPEGGTWYELDRTPGSMDMALQMPPRTGQALCLPTGSSTLYLMRGQGTPDVWHFDTVSSHFKDLPPMIVQAGMGLRTIGVRGAIYAVTGTDRRFIAYRPDTDEWSELAPLPDLVPMATGIAWDGDDFIYSICGYGLNFCRYSISGNNTFMQQAGSWVSADGGSLGRLPGNNLFTSGCQLAWGGGPYVYAGIAFNGGTGAFYRYAAKFPNPHTQALDTWQTVANIPGSFSQGSGLVWPGSGNLLYANPGGGGEFYCYDMIANKWSDGSVGAPAKPADYPGGYGSGDGTMCYPGRGRLIFALAEGPTGVTMLAYTLPGGPNGDTWQVLATAPGGIYRSASLSYPGSGRYLYAFPGFRSNTMWRYWKWSEPPAAPTALAQFRRDGTTPIAFGGHTGHDEIVVTATGSDSENDDVQLEWEIKPAATAFANAGQLTALAPSGNPARMALRDLVPGTPYAWQVRTVDDHGVPSAWVRGGTLPGYSVFARANGAPGISGLSQAGSVGPLPVGGLLVGSLIHLRATSQDSDAGDLSVVEVECRHVSQPFTGEPTQVSAPGVDPSADLEVAIEGEGGFRWRSRGRDEWGVAGPWASFGGNGEGEPDFLVNAIGSLNDGKACSTRGGASAILAGAWVMVLLRRRR